MEPLLTALICLRCASADCACGRLAGFAAAAALAEAAADATIVGPGDPEQDDVPIIEHLSRYSRGDARLRSRAMRRN